MPRKRRLLDVVQQLQLEHHPLLLQVKMMWGRVSQRRSERQQKKTRRWHEEELDGERRSNRGHALLTSVQIKFRREEYASGMGQRRNPNDAAVKGAQIKLGRDECALSMGQSSNDAAVMDARTKL
jgi:hypothetical protein